MNIEALKKRIDSADGRDYGAYQSLRGEYDYPDFKLFIDQIPKDPYAPSHTGIYRVELKNNFTSQFSAIFNSKVSMIAFRDFLARSFYNISLLKSKAKRGTGKSGVITINKPGQAIFERSSVNADKKIIEIRFFMGLPANGRIINSHVCEEMFFVELPQIIKQALFSENVDTKKLEKHIEAAEDAEFIRAKLNSLSLVAFIGNDSCLARKSGTSDEALDKKKAVPFKSPESLAMEIDLPNGGIIKGMGIPKGITLIVGGGYHGKTTLLNAIEMGIYNHIPGDGRERCISDNKAIKIRAYGGRYIEKVDISTFIDNLPLEKDTSQFSTENASGSTSQAASIIEAIEVGANAMLMDEDTCATNLMTRDQKMQKLVEKNDEPITTYIDRVESLYLNKGISTVLVSGGIGDYFQVSNLVIQMKNYLPIDVTDRAYKIFSSSPEKRIREGGEYNVSIKDRVPAKACVSPYNEYNKKRIYSTEVNRINFGRNIIDLSDVGQLIELSQTKAIGEAIYYIGERFDGKISLKEVVDNLMADIEKNGLDVLSDRASGHFAQFRGLDLVFAINRLRDLKIVN